MVRSLVNSNIWVALAVVSLCYISMEQSSILPLGFLAFVFFATIFAYSYMRLVQYYGFGKINLDLLKQGAWINWLYPILSGAAMLYFLRDIYRPGFLGILAVPALISFFYPITFPSADKSFTSLRVMPGLKLFLIAFTWSYMTVLLPVTLYGTLNLQSYLEFVFRILLIASLVIPFDIRDLQNDIPSMNTLPQLVGYKASRELAFFGVLVYQIWLIAKVFVFGLDTCIMIGLLIAFEIGAILIRRASPDKPDTYFSFWIEAVPIFAALAMIIAISLN